MHEGRTALSPVTAMVMSSLMLGGHIEAASAAVDPDAAEEAAICPWPAAVAEASSSLNHLGISYAKGMQGKRNPRLAMRFFLRAARQGYTPAMAKLGTLYQTGTLARKNFPRAYTWVRAALSFGVPEKDHDVTVMKLGMIAARLASTEIEQSEGLAETIAARILEACNCSPGNETALALNADALSQASAARRVNR
jgi:TPR repeat protein